MRILFYICVVLILVFFVVVLYLLQRAIDKLIKEQAELKVKYEEKILDILYDIKRMENKYVTAGTEMCKYLSCSISEHSQKWQRYKNELNIIVGRDV